MGTFELQRHIRKDRSSFPVHCASTDIVVGGRPALLLVVTDLSEIQGTESRRHFANKMEAIARLGGGVAHQFNNLLTAILSTADLAMTARELDESVRSDLGDIREAAQRAAAITRKLLAFSGSQSLSLKPTDVDHLLRQLEPMLTHVIPPNVTLQLRLASGATIETDPLRLEQVVLHLVVNAIDALGQGGSLAIGSRNVEGVPGSPTQEPRSGSFAEIVIADTGLGMDEVARSRLFEPFASTKVTAGTGMGLGLASTYGTIHQLGGDIVVESEPGRGTSMRLFLPRAPVPAPAPAATSAADQEFLPAEVVLVVEDEPVVRAPICRALRNQGYFVLEANNGEDALIVMQEYHSPIHLVISDVMMPEMDGAELVGLLRDWYPRMRVLFISGYSAQYLEARGGMVHGSAFLAKPFTLDELCQRVRAILDEEWAVP